MKRDWDLIRRILLAAEAAPAGQRLNAAAFPGEDPATLFEHVRLLVDRGFLDAALSPSRSGAGGGVFVIHRLIWNGHDLLDQMKSETWWAKVKAMMAERGVSMSFELLAELAVPAAKRLLNLED